MNQDLDTRLAQVAALADPVRRALYRFVVGRTEPTTREEAAAGLHLAVHVAKFHLDRLVADGLLAADYRRPPGRSGPGAGRPAKVYRRAGELDVSVPERRYDLAGQLLVRAIARATETGVEVATALDDVAYAAGRDAAPALATRAGTATRMRAVTDALESAGFEPEKRRGRVTLANCPFHRLACESPDVVCGMNLSFIRGLLEGAGADASATLDPAPNGERCCVAIQAN